MDTRQRTQQRSAGATWFDSLRTEQKWDIGDALVLGEFDWIDWLDEKPSSAFVDGIDDARIAWECERE